jgi:hypothetical protein
VAGAKADRKVRRKATADTIRSKVADAKARRKTVAAASVA